MSVSSEPVRRDWLRAPAALEPRTPWHLRGRIPPQVRSVPLADRLDAATTWYPHVYSLGFLYPPFAAFYAATHRYVDDIPDAEIARWADDSPFAKQVRPRDPAAIAELLGDAPTPDLPVDVVRFPARPFRMNADLHAADTTTVFTRSPESRHLHAIVLDGHPFFPGDGAAWRRAKHFAAFAMMWRLVGIDHTRTHFPMDTVLANTRLHLPREHTLARLLDPHSFVQQCVDHAVLYNPVSILRGYWFLPYTCFPCPFETTGAFLSAGWEGVDGEHQDLPPFTYPLHEPPGSTRYTRFLSAWFDLVLALCTDVAVAIPAGDGPTLRWAQANAEHLPGFPGPDTIFDGDNLARALAGFVYTVAVEHHVDHHTFGLLPVDHLPCRLRRPPPRPGEPIDEGPIASRLDLFRHRMAWRLYFRPRVFRRLVDVDYGFAQPELRQAQARHRERLARMDDRLRAEGIPVFLPADQVNTSLQA